MIRYRTFDQLMAGVESDLRNYADEGLIDRQNYIKVVRKVNADLGLKIYTDKEEILKVSDYKSVLPSDFMFLQMALACSVDYVKVPKLMGIQTEAHSCSEEEVPLDILNPCNNKCSFNECGGVMWITQKVGSKTYKYEHIRKLSVSTASKSFCSELCLNNRFKSPDQMHIHPDGETVSFSFREGQIYISYLSDMVDGEQNVLILDHPLVNDYYEYAVKEKLFENLEVGKDGDFEKDYMLMAQKKRVARIEAINFVNTPEYGDIIKLHEANRQRFYNRYARHFDEYAQGIFRT